MTAEPLDPPTPLAGDGVADAEDELAALYALSYAEPPWSEGPAQVAAYRARLQSWARRPSFAGLLARHRDGTLAGATYGWCGAPELRGVAFPGVDHAVVFHVGDLMVRPDARRSGLGRRLLDELVADRRPAVLVTHPDGGARRLYEAAGWLPTGIVAPPGAASLVTYLLP